MRTSYKGWSVSDSVLLVYGSTAVSGFISAGYDFSRSHRWAFGANRVQIDTDIRVLSEFSSSLQVDSVRGYPTISSFMNTQSVASMFHALAVWWFDGSDTSDRLPDCLEGMQFVLEAPGR